MQIVSENISGMDLKRMLFCILYSATRTLSDDTNFHQKLKPAIVQIPINILLSHWWTPRSFFTVLSYPHFVTVGLFSH
jgi:hypothetical protein